MSDDYRMKLRSSSTRIRPDRTILNEEEEIVVIHQYDRQSHTNNINSHNSSNSNNSNGNGNNINTNTNDNANTNTNTNTNNNNNKRSDSPKTPPIVETDSESNIESYFPPSPYGRKRQQVHGDRFIPARDRNLARDFQMVAPYPSAEPKTPTSAETEQTPTNRDNVVESRRISAFFRAEVLDDPTAVDEFVTSDSLSRTPRRVLHFSGSSRSPVLSPTLVTTGTGTGTGVVAGSGSGPGSGVGIGIGTGVSVGTGVAVGAGEPSSSNSPVATFDSPTLSRFQTSPIGEAGRRILSSSDRLNRNINTSAIKVLDAPELQDDFYLNLVDWGSDNCLAVGLGTCVYLWNANTSRVAKLCDFLSDSVTSVNWAQFGSLLAVGTNSGRSFLYDVTESKRIRTWTNHSLRVGSLAWSSNILSTGGRDHYIYHHDVRSAEPYFRKLTGHTQEVCGLRWSPDGSALASGGNDNNLMIWDSHENIISHRLNQHTAAIKAIAWSPHKRGILVSGGGTADKTIKFWNTITGSLTSSYDTGSQVCNICWSKKTDDVVSSHGYSNSAVSSSNQVIVWKSDKMQRVATLTGHTSRVLYMSMSNDGSTVVTGAGDETLRFWDVFSSVDSSKSESADRRSCIR